MTLTAFLDSWRGQRAETRWSRLIILLLVAVNLVTATLAIQRETVVILQPPDLNETAQVGRRQADAAYKSAWALFFAQLLGNVSPGNDDLILNALGPLLSPALYQAVRATLADELRVLRDERLTTSFAARQVEYDPHADRVSVYGRLETTGPTQAKNTSDRTYEFQIGIINYRPQLQDLAVYSGRPRPREQREKDAKAREDAARN